MGTERQSNIELARILASIGVIILHYNNPNIGGGFKYAEGTNNLYILYFLESVFICAVNLFVLISGYFLCKSNRRNLWKPIELIAQVIVFSFGIYIFKITVFGEEFSIKTVIARLIPANYFAVLYSVLYIMSPFINIVFTNLTKEKSKLLMMFSVALFAVYPTLVDVLCEITGRQWIGLSTIGAYGAQWGYTIVNFMLMYMIGAYLRLKGSFILKISWKVNLFILLVCEFILVIWARINDTVGFYTERSAWEYCNPIVILSAVLIFCLFAKMNFGVNKFINRLANSTFTVYLLHGVFLPYIGIEKAVTGNVMIMLLHICLSVIAIYICCLCVHFIYSWIIKHILGKLRGWIRLPELNLDK